MGCVCPFWLWARGYLRGTSRQMPLAILCGALEDWERKGRLGTGLLLELNLTWGQQVKREES